MRQIFNGRSTSSPSLGRFCGSQLPSSIPTSSSHQLTVQFVSNSDGQTSSGFHANYTELLLGCGGRIQLSADRLSALITSPSYPNTYPHSIDCTWTVTAPANRKVQLQFIGDIFDIERHTRCVRTVDEVGRNTAVLNSSCHRKHHLRPFLGKVVVILRGMLRPLTLRKSKPAAQYFRYVVCITELLDIF